MPGACWYLVIWNKPKYTPEVTLFGTCFHRYPVGMFVEHSLYFQLMWQGQACGGYVTADYIGKLSEGARKEQYGRQHSSVVLGSHSASRSRFPCWWTVTSNPNARFPLGLLLVMVLITEKENKLRQKLVPYKALLEGWTGGGLWKHLELWAGKVLECKELNGLFCSSLEDKDAERSADSAVLASEVSEGSKDTLGLFLLRTGQNTICAPLWKTSFH